VFENKGTKLMTCQLGSLTFLLVFLQVQVVSCWISLNSFFKFCCIFKTLLYFKLFLNNFKCVSPCTSFKNNFAIFKEPQQNNDKLCPLSELNSKWIFKELLSELKIKRLGKYKVWRFKDGMFCMMKCFRGWKLTRWKMWCLLLGNCLCDVLD